MSEYLFLIIIAIGLLWLVFRPGNPAHEDDEK